MSGYHKYVRLKMGGLPEPQQTLKYEVCFDFCVCDVCYTSENPLPVGEGVWSMCNTMKTGRYCAWLLTVAGQMLIGSELGTKQVHYIRCVAYRHVHLLTLSES